MMILKLLRKIVPQSVKRPVYCCLQKYRARAFARIYPSRCVRTVERLKNKSSIRVAFFMIHDSVWKYDELFKLMLSDKRFDPVIVVCPYVASGEKIMRETMAKSEGFVRSKGYPLISTYGEASGVWLDVRNEVKPDIVFFTNPHEGLTRDEYYMYNYPDALTCYVPYSSMIFNSALMGRSMHSLVWSFFVENTITQSIVHADTKVYNNTYVVGYPSTEPLYDRSFVSKNVWKHGGLKRIIWAPHHTITEDPVLKISNFLDLAEPMVELAKLHKDRVQFAFKPHPILYAKLIAVWGEEKVSRYYDLWRNMENTQVELGEYIDLFVSSDAMIFDSGSFVGEYLYTQKPSLFVCSDGIESQMNQYGRMALGCHQQASGMEGITNFVDSIVAGLEDPKAETKKEFFDKYLVPPNGMSASQNILNYLASVLTK